MEWTENLEGLKTDHLSPAITFFEARFLLWAEPLEPESRNARDWKEWAKVSYLFTSSALDVLDPADTVVVVVVVREKIVMYLLSYTTLLYHTLMIVSLH